MKYYIMFGPPGAGKGTQAKLIVEKFKFRHISTGEVLRREINAGSELGIKAKALIEKGAFVSDEIVEGIIGNEIAGNRDANGFLFDGFPRTIAQAEALDAMLEKRGEEVTGVISIMIDDATVKERIRHRAEIENRKDDMDEATIENRIRTYHEKTEPLVGYYKKQGKYLEIKGEGGIENIFERICGILE